MGLAVIRFRPLQRTEFYTQDCIARFYGKRAPIAPELVYLAIDHDSISLDQFEPAEIGRSPALTLMKQGWPWSRAVHGMVLDRLVSAGAQVVAFDLLFPTPRDGDDAFRAALEKNRDRVVMGSNFLNAERSRGDTRTHQLPDSGLIPPSSPLDDRVGFVNFWPDFDEVIRRVIYRVTESEVFGDTPNPGEEEFDSLSVRALRKISRADSIPAGTATRRIRFAGGPNTFLPRSVCDLFDEKKWRSPEYRAGEFFRGKIVLVGPEGNFMKDLVLTPFGFIAGPELHLSALNAALSGSFVRETSSMVNGMLIFCAGVLAWALCIRFPAPLLRLAFLALAAGGWLLGAQLLYNHAGLIILTFAPLIALGSSGVCCLSWDFFVEKRDKARVRRTLERYISKAAVKDIIDNPSSFFQTLGGVRKPVAVLFTDLRGFTAMTENADSHVLVGMLNEYFGAMVEPILENHGSLDKYIGDAIMAVWGNIQSRGPAEDVRAAVLTALRMREQLAGLNKRWQAAGQKSLGMGLGINFGEAIVGNIGSVHQMNLTVIGDVVNLASRIEGVTKEFGIDLLVGEDAAALVGEWFHLQSVGPVKVKGRKGGVELFTVAGERNGHSDTQFDEYLRVYHEAMALYRRGEFPVARSTFEQAHGLRPNETLALLFAVRCSALEEGGPIPNWDGVFVMTEK